MKKLLIMMLFSLLLSGCNGDPDESEFADFSEEFYVQMFTDGEQSQEVKDMYEQYKTEYKSFKDHELYVNINGMYQALGNGEAATDYQLEVMRIINK